MTTLLFFSALLVGSPSQAGDFDHLKSDRHWTRTPRVYVCDGTGIDPARVNDAIAFWRAQGFALHSRAGIRDCDLPMQLGHITIGLFAAGENPDYFNGLAHSFNFKNSSERAYAHIQLRRALRHEPELIIHELGHALGLKDDDSDPRSVMTHEKVY